MVKLLHKQQLGYMFLLKENQTTTSKSSFLPLKVPHMMIYFHSPGKRKDKLNKSVRFLS